jgi:hypothetical protein
MAAYLGDGPAGEKIYCRPVPAIAKALPRHYSLDAGRTISENPIAWGRTRHFA